MIFIIHGNELSMYPGMLHVIREDLIMSEISAHDTYRNT